MNKICFLIFIFLSFSATGQDVKKIIYVDPSFSEIRKVFADSIIQIIKKSDDDFILYVSKNSTPLISISDSSLTNTLSQMRLEYFSSPDYNKDIKLLNSQIIESDFINISRNSYSRSLSNKLDFYFFLDKNEISSFDLEKEFIKKLLISNNLIFSEGLHKDCRVKIYQENQKKITIKQLNK